MNAHRPRFRMDRHTALGFPFLAAVLLLLVAVVGCAGATPTPTPTPVPPTATPTAAPVCPPAAAPTPRPATAPTEAPAEDVTEPTTYELDRLAVEDGLYQLRMGETTAWGYNAGDRISSNVGDGIKITVNLGDTLFFSRLSASTSRSSKPHSFVNEELGLNVTLNPGDRREPFKFKITAPGIHVIDDPAEPGAKGTFVIEALGEGLAGPAVYALDQLVLEDCAYHLRMGDTTAWGYNAGDQIDSNVGTGIKITVIAGDTLSFGAVRASSERSSKPQSIANRGLELNLTLTPGERVEPFEIELNTPGTFVIDDPADPGVKGAFVIVVQE